MFPIHPIFITTAITLLLLASIPFLDLWWHDAITGFTISATFLFCVGFWAVFIRQMRERKWREVKQAEHLLQRLQKLTECGEGCIYSILFALTAAILIMFVLVPLSSGAPPVILNDGGPPAWQMLAVGLSGLILIKRRSH